MSGDTLLFELDTGGLDVDPEPGQFIQLVTSDSLALPRPFSIAGAEPGGIEVLFEVRGRGTRELARLSEGDTLRALGPLGNGFQVPDDVDRATLVAGGVGVAGLRLLARRLCDSGLPVDIIVGARTADRLLDQALPAQSGLANVTVTVATEDGSAGEHGTACDVLMNRLERLGENDIVYACGPRAMLRGVAACVASSDVRCQLSLEEMMACGVGACRGCVIDTRSGYRSVCSDGPVFDSREVIFGEDADA